MKRFYVFDDFDSILLSRTQDLYEMIDEEKELKDGKVEVLINSPGGEVSVLIALLDAFDYAKKNGVTVATKVTGLAASCGSLLAVAGTPGHRTMSKHSHHYVHLGSASAVGRTKVAFDRYAGYAGNHFDWVEEIYRKYTKIPGLKKKLEQDHLFVGFDEALKWRMIDGE